MVSTHEQEISLARTFNKPCQVCKTKHSVLSMLIKTNACARQAFRKGSLDERKSLIASNTLSSFLHIEPLKALTKALT